MSKPAKSKAVSISYDPIILTSLPIDSVHLAKARLWVHERIKLELGTEDEIVENLVISTIEEHAKDRAREWSVDLQIQLTGFLEGGTPKFMSDLWKAFLSGFKDSGEENDMEEREDDERRAKMAGVPPPPSHPPPPGLEYGNPDKDVPRLPAAHDGAGEVETGIGKVSKRELRRERERDLDNPLFNSDVSESESSGSGSERGSSKEGRKRKRRHHRHDSKRKRSKSRSRKHDRSDKRGSRRKHRRQSDISDDEEEDEKEEKWVRRGDGLEDEKERSHARHPNKLRNAEEGERSLLSESESESHSDRRRRKHKKSKQHSKSRLHRKHHRSDRRREAGYFSSSGSGSDKEESRHKDRHRSRRHRRDDSDYEDRSDSGGAEDERRARKRKRQRLNDSEGSGDERKYARKEKRKARHREDTGNISDGSMESRDPARLRKYRKEYHDYPPRSPRRGQRDSESSLDSRRPLVDDDRIRGSHDYEHRSGLNRPEHPTWFAPRHDRLSRDRRRRNPRFGSEPDLRETLIDTRNRNDDRGINQRFLNEKDPDIRFQGRRDNRGERSLNRGDPGPRNDILGNGSWKNEPMVPEFPEILGGGSGMTQDLRDMITERREMRNVRQDNQKSHDFGENVTIEIEPQHEHDKVNRSGEKPGTAKEEDDELAQKASSKKLDEGRLLREKLLVQVKRKRKAKELRQMALESLRKRASIDGGEGRSPLPTEEANAENHRESFRGDLHALDAEQGGSSASDQHDAPGNIVDRDGILELVGSEHVEPENDDMKRNEQGQAKVEMLEKLEASAAVAEVDTAEAHH